MTGEAGEAGLVRLTEPRICAAVIPKHHSIQTCVLFWSIA